MTYDAEMDRFDAELDRLDNLPRSKKKQRARSGIELHSRMHRLAEDRSKLTPEQAERFEKQQARLLKDVFGIEG